MAEIRTFRKMLFSPIINMNLTRQTFSSKVERSRTVYKSVKTDIIEKTFVLELMSFPSKFSVFRFSS